MTKAAEQSDSEILLRVLENGRLARSSARQLIHHFPKGDLPSVQKPFALTMLRVLLESQ